MAKLYKQNDTNKPRTRAEREHALSERDLQASINLRAKHRRERRGMKRLDIDGHSMPGDRTHNAPSLRKDAKFRNRLDLPTHTYKTEPRGICACVDSNGDPDIPFTLAVLQHYRHIIASRQQTPEMRIRNDAG